MKNFTLIKLQPVLKHQFFKYDIQQKTKKLYNPALQPCFHTGFEVTQTWRTIGFEHLCQSCSTVNEYGTSPPEAKQERFHKFRFNVSQKTVNKFQLKKH